MKDIEDISFTKYLTNQYQYPKLVFMLCENPLDSSVPRITTVCV